MHKHFSVRWLLATLAMAASPLFAQPCLTTYTFTANPPPVGGTYQSGQAVQFCFTITNWNTTNANWFHGLVPAMGPGWDMSTLVPGPGPAAQGGSGGTWSWFASNTGTAGTAIGTVGPGYFFDLDNDGNSGNNFGDYVNGPCNFQFCWTVSVAVGANCITGGDLSMTANVYGDSETGSWGASGCNGDVNPAAPATAECCDADPGLPGVVVVCEDEAPVDLFTLLLGTPDATGTWTDPVGNPCSAILDPATAASGNYTYTVPDVTPCPSVQSTVTVTISQVVDAGEDNALTLCIDAAPLDMLGALNGTPQAGGVWTSPSGVPSNGTFVAATDQPGVYTYFLDAQAPCADHSSTLTIAVDPAPWAGSDALLVRCANDPSVELFPLLGGAPDNGGYWIDPTLVTHSGMLHPPTAFSGAYGYVVLGAGTCTHLIDTGFVNVTINPLPVISFTADPDSGCAPLLVTLTNTTPLTDVGMPCMWNFGDGLSVEGCGSIDHLYEEPGSYPVHLTVTSPLGCTNFLLRQNVVLVEPAPVADFFFSPNPGTVGNSTIYFTAEDAHPVYYGWTLDSIPLGEGVHAQQWFNDVLGSTHEVCLNVRDRYGCVDTLCQTVPIIIPSSFVPNAFTPDGDGLNDKFYPALMDMVATENLFQVFDRWGEMIYSSANPMEGWDGKAGGDVVPQGVYVWRLETLPAYTADKVSHIGMVVVLK